MLLLLALACRSEPSPKATPAAGSCETTFTYRAEGEADFDGVFLAGDWDGWDPSATPLTEVSPGLWSVSLPLEPGPHGYRFVEFQSWTYDGHRSWVCDPEAPLIQCDEGYTTVGNTDWAQTCTTGEDSSCNSLIVVEDCARPTLSLTALQIDRAAKGVQASIAFVPGAGGEGLGASSVTLDGAPLSLSWVDDQAVIDLSGLTPTRHTLRAVATDAAGREAEALYVPFWLDQDDAGDAAWRSAPLYFAFVDRMQDGDPANSAPEGTSIAIGDYEGGDYAGLIALLPYLQSLGVGALWLSNASDNAEGPWAGACGQTIAGYHAYWPDAARDVEEHFGTEADLHDLVDAAHASGMRVLMDWVGNHVHEDHPYYTEHAADGWFTEASACDETVGGQLGYDRIPETCWFAGYLPDLDYTHPEPLVTMVDDALWWVKTYELDGLRVDAVKHMNHAVAWNLEAKIQAEVEHRAVGGDESFWTVGETFDGYERIANYLSKGDQKGLDGQFDFPMYYTQLGAFATRTSSLADLEGTVAASEAAFGDALMSGFLGNHDVVRWTSYAAEGYQGSCEGDGLTPRYAAVTTDPAIYARLRLSWTFLFTQPAVPLVYYGDELGMPGYADPDNRKPLWELAGDLSGVWSVDDLAAQVTAEQASVLRHVASLAAARKAHPAMWRGTTTEWWLGPSDWATVWAYARTDADTGDAVLVAINNGDDDVTLTNGLAFAGLPTGGTWTDTLSGETFTAAGDSLSFWLPARSSRVLVP